MAFEDRVKREGQTVPVVSWLIRLVRAVAKSWRDRRSRPRILR